MGTPTVESRIKLLEIQVNALVKLNNLMGKRIELLDKQMVEKDKEIQRIKRLRDERLWKD